MNEPIFRDRAHAGRLLADALVKYANREDVIALGLPRGGVAVASEVAQKLHVPLDVLVVKKLGVPGWEELAMGAIASGGVRVINDRVLRQAGISDDMIDQAASVQLKELRRREKAYRGYEGVPDIEGRTVILVDDGIATGATARAAIEALKLQGAGAIIVAVPAASVEARELLEPMVDEFVALVTPERFRAVSQWYEVFDQTSDAEVTELLAVAARMTPKSAAGHGTRATCTLSGLS